jgi:hypothetical protein
MRGARLVGLWTCVVAPSFVIGCQWLAGLEAPSAPEKGNDVAGDASLDAPPDAAAGAIDPCSPDVPLNAGDSDPTARHVLFVVRSVDYGKQIARPDGGPPFDAGAGAFCPTAARDLDGLDSRCPGPVGSCAPFVGSTNTCDKPGGADDVFSELLGAISGVFEGGDNAPFAPSDQIERGGSTILIVVTGYNGLDFDTVVTVSFLVASGTAHVEEPDGALIVAQHVPPRWDGTDTWFVDPTSLVSSQLPKYTTARAYVAGGVLVIPIDRLDFPVAIAGTHGTLPLLGGWMTARIVRDDSGTPLRLEQGRLTSRTTVAALMANASALPDGCAGASFEFLRAQACGRADLLESGEVDPKRRCDALSLGVGFVAYPAANWVPDESLRSTLLPCAGPDGGALVETCE